MVDSPEKTRSFFYDKGLWVTADGRVYKPNGFDNTHFVNTIIYLVKRSQHNAHKHPFAEHLRAELGNRPRWVVELVVDKITEISMAAFGWRVGSNRQTEAIEWWTYYCSLETEHGLNEIEMSLYNLLMGELNTSSSPMPVINEEGEFTEDVE